MARSTDRVTIRDVAKLAGVSFKTVSRVLNGVASVDPELRSKVEVATKQLGYRPNRAARLLGGGRSSTLALILGDNGLAEKAGKPTRPPTFIFDVMTGAMRACRENHHNLLVLEISDDPRDGVADLDRSLADLPIDGAVLMPPLCDYPWLLDYLETHKIAFARILAGAREDRGIALTVDNSAAGLAVAERILELGHTRVGLVTAPEGHLAGQRRVAAFRERMLAAPEVTLVERPGDFYFEGGLSRGGELLDLPEPPSVVFAANDEMAAGVLAAASDRHIEVPGALSVIGFGDLWISRQTWPRLSTVHQPIIEMAHAAAYELTRTSPTDPVPAKQIVRPFSLTERQTLSQARRTSD